MPHTYIFLLYFVYFRKNFKGIIDYIFATKSSLRRLGIIGPFDSAWITKNEVPGFPHPKIPSDHVPIMAQYAIKAKKRQRCASYLKPKTFRSILKANHRRTHNRLTRRQLARRRCIKVSKHPIWQRNWARFNIKRHLRFARTAARRRTFRA